MKEKMKADNKTARVAGALYVVIILGSIIGGVFSEMYMQSHLAGEVASADDILIVPEWMYRIGFSTYLLVYASDLALSFIFYILLKPVNRGLALLSAFFRFAEATLLGINMLNHYNAFLLLSGSGAYLSTFQVGQLQSLASLFLNAHRSGYLFGQVFFGIHCFFLGYLFFKSGYFPKFLGVLLVLASFGYLIESFSFFLLTNYETMEAINAWIVAVPAFLAELSLAYWLLFKSINVQEQLKSFPSYTARI
jgi:hypothetical protein